MNLHKIGNDQKPFKSHVINFQVLNFVINHYELKVNHRNTLYTQNMCIVAPTAVPYTL
jgi:hypothetical protein